MGVCEEGGGCCWACNGDGPIDRGLEWAWAGCMYGYKSGFDRCGVDWPPNPRHNPPRLQPKGFRDRAELLESTFQRMGVLAALRSCSMGGATIGM